MKFFCDILIINIFIYFLDILRFPSEDYFLIYYSVFNIIIIIQKRITLFQKSRI